MEITFQITQNFGGGSFGFEYFKISKDATLEEIKAEALRVQRLDYANRFPGFAGKALEKPTITVKEYFDGKKVRGGIEFKIKWR